VGSPGGERGVPEFIDAYDVKTLKAGLQRFGPAPLRGKVAAWLERVCAAGIGPRLDTAGTTIQSEPAWGVGSLWAGPIRRWLAQGETTCIPAP